MRVLSRLMPVQRYFGVVGKRRIQRSFNFAASSKGASTSHHLVSTRSISILTFSTGFTSGVGWGGGGCTSISLWVISGRTPLRINQIANAPNNINTTTTTTKIFAVLDMWDIL